jgi:hypothetical protein
MTDSSSVRAEYRAQGLGSKALSNIMLVRAVFHVKRHCSKKLRLFHVKHNSQAAYHLSDQQMMASRNQEMVARTDG